MTYKKVLKSFGCDGAYNGSDGIYSVRLAVGEMFRHFRQAKVSPFARHWFATSRCLAIIQTAQHCLWIKSCPSKLFPVYSVIQIEANTASQQQRAKAPGCLLSMESGAPDGNVSSTAHPVLFTANSAVPPRSLPSHDELLYAR